MDVMRTPPHSTNPVAYFGEATFLWAPKKPRQYHKPPLRSGRKSSSRSLDFSSIIVHENDGDNPSLGSHERRQTQTRSRSTRHDTPVFVRKINSPSSNHGSPLAFENTIARRIDFASQSFTPGQETAADTSDSPSVFSPGLSPAAKSILVHLKCSESTKRSSPTSEQHCTSRSSEHHRPNSSSPNKRGRWTRLIR